MESADPDLNPRGDSLLPPLPQERKQVDEAVWSSTVQCIRGARNGKIQHAVRSQPRARVTGKHLTPSVRRLARKKQSKLSVQDCPGPTREASDTEKWRAVQALGVGWVTILTECPRSVVTGMYGSHYLVLIIATIGIIIFIRFLGCHNKVPQAR